MCINSFLKLLEILSKNYFRKNFSLEDDIWSILANNNQKRNNNKKLLCLSYSLSLCIVHSFIQPFSHVQDVTHSQLLADFKWFESRVFHLLDLLPYLGQRAQSLHLFPQSWREKSWIHRFLNNISAM